MLNMTPLLAGAVFIARQACSDRQVKKNRGADMIVAANWKMNPALDQATVLATALASQPFSEIKRILFVPHPYLVPISVRLTGAPLQIGGQDCQKSLCRRWDELLSHRAWAVHRLLNQEAPTSGIVP